MPILTTFNSTPSRIATVENAAKGLALANNTVYYALNENTIREISLGTDPTINDYTLEDYGELFVDVEGNTQIEYNNETDVIEFIESYNDVLIIGTKRGTDLIISTFNVAEGLFTDSHDIPYLPIDRITKHEYSFAVMSGNTAIIFYVKPLGTSVPKVISGAQTVLFDRSISTMYYVHSSDLTSVRKANYIAHGDVSTFSLADSVLLTPTSGSDINHIVISQNNILVSTTTEMTKYDEASLTEISTIAIHAPYEVTQSFKTDTNGHVFANTSTTSIYDTTFNDFILPSTLAGINSVELQSVEHVQDNTNNIVLQTNEALLFFTDTTPSFQVQSVVSLNAPIEHSENMTAIDHGRVFEYIMPIGSHKLSIKCNDASPWQENFDLSFYVDSGFDKRLKQLEETAEIKCTLKLIVDGIATDVTVNLTNIFDNKDHLTSKHNLLDYRLFDDITMTLREFLSGKTVFFDISPEHNIFFDFKVISSIRINKHSTLRFHLLKLFRYANSSRLILTQTV